MYVCTSLVCVWTSPPLTSPCVLQWTAAGARGACGRRAAWTAGASGAGTAPSPSRGTGAGPATADNCTGGLCIQSEWGRTSLRPRGQSAGPLGAVGAKRPQDGDAILPSFMDSVVLQEGAGGASGFVATSARLCFIDTCINTHTQTLI